MLVLKLPPEVAIGTGLITEVFGFSSGLFAYIRKGLIDFKLGKKTVNCHDSFSFNRYMVG